MLRGTLLLLKLKAALLKHRHFFSLICRVIACCCHLQNMDSKTITKCFCRFLLRFVEVMTHNADIHFVVLMWRTFLRVSYFHW